MLEKMKAKVDEEESLAEAYGEVGEIGDVDDEISRALSSGETSSASDSLAALKAKMGIS